jgi:hypothetical protein
MEKRVSADSPLEPQDMAEMPQEPHRQSDSLLLGIFTRDGKLQGVAEVPPEQLPTLLAATGTLAQTDETDPAPRKRGRRAQLPELTPTHHTQLPNTPSFDALRQSFGPGVGMQLSLWDHTREPKFELAMPSGASLTIAGNNTYESMALHRYVTSELGPEGLKHLLVLLDVYYLKTGGKDRKTDAVVSIRQLLLRLGKGKKADEREEQQKFMKTILYLARTFVSSGTKSGSRSKSISPLLVLERLDLEPDEEGKFQIPCEIEYHLGQHFFETLFGKQPQYFSVPTMRLLSYHAVCEQQELLLAFYLSSQLTWSGGECSLHFVTLLLQSALQSAEGIRQGINRTREAQRVLYALERLEQDGIIVRAPHDEVDMVLAIDLYNDPTIAKKLAQATQTRLGDLLPSFKGWTAEVLRAKRRKALQRLLSEDAPYEEHPVAMLTFSTGPLLAQQIERILYQDTLEEKTALPSSGKEMTTRKRKSPGRREQRAEIP